MYVSISVLFADALDLVEAEPVVGFGHFGETDDEFVGLLGDLAVLGEDEALGLGDGEDPVLALVVVDADLEGSVQEAGDDFVSWQVSDVVEGDVDSRLGGSYFTNFFSSR